MKKRIIFNLFVFLLSVLFLMSCSNLNQNSNQNSNDSSHSQSTDEDKTKEEYNSLENQYFAYGIKKSNIENYVNGRTNTSNDKSFSYLKDDELFNAQYNYSTRSRIDSIDVVVVYEFTGSVSIHYYESMMELTLIGVHNATGISEKTVSITSSASATYKYTTTVMTSDYKLPDFNKVKTYIVSETSSSITDDMKEKTYSAVKKAWSYMVDVMKEIDSSKAPYSLYNESDFTSQKLISNGVKFENKTIKLNGEKHGLYAENVMDGVKVEYVNNEVDEPGTHEIIANFYDPSGKKFYTLKAKITIDDYFDILIQYRYKPFSTLQTRDFLVCEEEVSGIKYSSDLRKIVNDNVPSGYKISDSDNEAISWVYSNFTIVQEIVPVHEYYIYVESKTNSQLDKKYIPFRALFDNQSDTQKITYAFDSDSPILYRLSDINKIKFCNSPDFFSSLFEYDGSYFSNLEEIDLSELQYVEEIPSRFFAGCSSLKRVIGGKLNNLRSIGNSFLSYTNITDFDLDLSDVVEVGANFMAHAFEGNETRNVLIDLSNLQKISTYNNNEIPSIPTESLVGPGFLIQKEMNKNSKISLRIGSYLLSDGLFYEKRKNENDEWEYYGSYNIDVYTKYPNQTSTLLKSLKGKLRIVDLSTKITNVLSISRNLEDAGTIITNNVYGYSNVNEKMQSNDYFEIGYIQKIFTSGTGVQGIDCFGNKKTYWHASVTDRSTIIQINVPAEGARIYVAFVTGAAAEERKMFLTKKIDGAYGDSFNSTSSYGIEMSYIDCELTGGIYYLKNTASVRIYELMIDLRTEYKEITAVAETNEGYVFLGWFIDGEKVTEELTYDFVVSLDSTYEAKWNPKKYTISLDNQAEGIAITGVTDGNAYDCGSQITLSATNIPLGYTVKWEKGDDVYFGENYSFKMPSSSITIIITTNFYFGSYPQTKVNDNRLINELNMLAGTLPTSINRYNWTDYNYYLEGNITSYMYYQDIDFDNDGTYDYRGVYFTQYRSFYPINPSLTNASFQDDNGYVTNTIYWFRYDPIEWYVLTETGNKALIIAGLILDSQEYNPSSYNGGTIYENNYELSNIRKFLNDDFYSIAFNDLQKSLIETIIVDNSVISTGQSSNKYVCNDTSDNIFLLSYTEANTYLEGIAMAKATDYAKCQGLYCFERDFSDVEYWIECSYWTRSPCESGGVYCMKACPNIQLVPDNHDLTSIGVRPACWINLNI